MAEMSEPRCLEAFHNFWKSKEPKKEIFRPILFANVKGNILATDDTHYIIKAGTRVRVLDKRDDGLYGISDCCYTSAFTPQHWRARVPFESLENFSYTYKKT